MNIIDDSEALIVPPRTGVAQETRFNISHVAREVPQDNTTHPQLDDATMELVPTSTSELEENGFHWAFDEPLINFEAIDAQAPLWDWASLVHEG
jgi:hypothetical protein